MHTAKLRVLMFGLFASAGALALSGCGSNSEGTIQIYTGRHYDLEVAFEAFVEEFIGFRIDRNSISRNRCLEHIVLAGFELNNGF